MCCLIESHGVGAEEAFSATELSSRETSRGTEADVALLDLALVC